MKICNQFTLCHGNKKSLQLEQIFRMILPFEIVPGIIFKKKK